MNLQRLDPSSFQLVSEYLAPNDLLRLKLTSSEMLARFDEHLAIENRLIRAKIMYLKGVRCEHRLRKLEIPMIINNIAPILENIVPPTDLRQLTRIKPFSIRQSALLAARKKKSVAPPPPRPQLPSPVSLESLGFDPFPVILYDLMAMPPEMMQATQPRVTVPAKTLSSPSPPAPPQQSKSDLVQKESPRSKDSKDLQTPLEGQKRSSSSDLGQRIRNSLAQRDSELVKNLKKTIIKNRRELLELRFLPRILPEKPAKVEPKPSLPYPDPMEFEALLPGVIPDLETYDQKQPGFFTLKGFHKFIKDLPV